MTRTVLWSASIAVLIVAGGGNLHAQQKILFLHLRMQNDTVRLVGSNIRPGTVKPDRNKAKHGAIEYEFRSSSGILLLQGSIADPSVRRYEYEDPANPGRLAAKRIAADDVEFTLRVPFDEAMRRIDFYRSPYGASPSVPAAVQRTSLGTIDMQRMDGAR